MTLTPYDRSLIDPNRLKCVLYFYGYDEFMEFQFPPRVPSDNRSFKWKESEAYAFEPILSFTGNGARSITLKWQYIVESEEYDPYSSKWTIGRIKRMINMLRAYHSLAIGDGTAITNMDGLVCRLKVLGVAGPTDDGTSKSWTVAINNISINHGDTYIGPPEYAFPLSTNITADLKLWVNDGLFSSPNDESTVVSVNGLDSRPAIEDYWY